MALMTCHRCGGECEKGGNRKKYCLPCRDDVRRERQREIQLRRSRAAGAKPVPESGCCARCQGSFKPSNARQIYCKPCAPVAKAETTRQWARAEALSRGAVLIEGSLSCERCSQETPRRSHGQKYCPSCKQDLIRTKRREAMAQARAADPEKVRARKKDYYHRNSSKVRAYQKSRQTPEFWKARAARHAERMQRDPKFRLRKRIANSIYRSLRAKKSRRSWQHLVGYTADDLRVHLERQFLPGMGWHNMGEWHIDHIIPVSAFSYETPEDPDFKVCWALTNLRPLWAADNLKKKDRRETLL